MPDFFDRLVSRSLPELAGSAPDQDGRVAGQAWVRPRLPQLFERPGLEIQETEVVQPRPPEADVGAAPVPADVRIVERTTVLPSVQAARETRMPGPPPGVPAPAPTAVPQREGHAFVHAERGERAETAVGPRLLPPEERRPPVGAAAAVSAVRRPAAPFTSAPLVTRTVPLTPADPRRAASSAGAEGRGDRQPPERVVRINIGRLAVTAAAPGHEGRDRERPGRPAPRVSLDRYLGHEEG